MGKICPNRTCGDIDMAKRKRSLAMSCNDGLIMMILCVFCMCLSDSAIFTCIGNCWLDSLDQFLLHSLTALMFKSCMLIKMQTSDNPTSDVQMKGSMGSFESRDSRDSYGQGVLGSFRWMWRSCLEQRWKILTNSETLKEEGMNGGKKVPDLWPLSYSDANFE